MVKVNITDQTFIPDNEEVSKESILVIGTTDRGPDVKIGDLSEHFPPPSYDVYDLLAEQAKLGAKALDKQTFGTMGLEIPEQSPEDLQEFIRQWKATTPLTTIDRGVPYITKIEYPNGHGVPTEEGVTCVEIPVQTPLNKEEMLTDAEIKALPLDLKVCFMIRSWDKTCMPRSLPEWANIVGWTAFSHESRHFDLHVDHWRHIALKEAQNKLNYIREVIMIPMDLETLGYETDPEGQTEYIQELTKRFIPFA